MKNINNTPITRRNKASDPDVLASQLADIVHNGYTSSTITTMNQRYESSYVNIKDFGAYGDYNIGTGTGHDDTTAIQAAINYAISSNNVLFIPKGVYKISSTLTINNGLYIKGVFETDSRGAGSLLYYTGTGTAIDCSNGTNWLYAPKFQHFRIHSSGNANIGLKLGKVTECDVLDIHFNQGFNTALYCNNVTITNIERCDFSANKIGLMFAHETSDVQNMAVNIKGCNFWQNSIAHVKMNNCLGINFSNNWFEYSPIAIWLDNDNAGGSTTIVDLNITNNEISVGDNVAYPNSKGVKVTTTNATIDMTVLALNIKENLIYNKSTDYNIVFDLTNSTANCYVKQSFIDRNLLWGGGTSAIYGTDSTKIQIYIRENDCRTAYYGSFGTLFSGNLTQITPNPGKCAMVTLNANQSIINNTATFPTWNTVNYDEMGFFNGGSPTQFTIPSGVSKIVIRGQVMWDVNATGTRTVDILKNGASFAGRSVNIVNAASSGNTFQEITTPPIPVVAGDRLQLWLTQTSGAALNIVNDQRTWFSIQVIE